MNEEMRQDLEADFHAEREAPTPRTDEVDDLYPGGWGNMAEAQVHFNQMTDLARQLERDLAVAQEGNRVWRDRRDAALEQAEKAEAELRASRSASAATEPCCQKYETCLQSCTPRGRWQAEQEFARSSTTATFTEKRTGLVDRRANDPMAPNRPYRRRTAGRRAGDAERRKAMLTRSAITATKEKK